MMKNVKSKKGKKSQRKQLQNELLNRYAKDILNSKNFQSSSKNTQHGSMSVLQHSINVAKCSITLNEKLGIKCQKKDLVRGALLHDYFLYDWHDKDHVQLYRLHGFHHPMTALKNASKEYQLTPREKDIIKKHMWPLTIKPPVCREAWVVTAADKYCSLMETLRIHKGNRKR